MNQTAVETVKAKRAEYQAELERLEEQRAAFVGAIAACDDILKALEGNEDEDTISD